MTDILREFANEPREVHSLLVGTSFGALTAFVWAQFSSQAGLALGLGFLSAVTGIRLRRALRTTTDAYITAEEWIAEPTHLVQQVRREGHYTVTAFAVAAIVVTVAIVIWT
jgi:hypothetical protein